MNTKEKKIRIKIKFLVNKRIPTKFQSKGKF